MTACAGLLVLACDPADVPENESPDSFQSQARALGIPTVSSDAKANEYLGTMTPGIVVYRERQGDYEYTYPLVAVSTDGGAFVIPDIFESNMTALPGVPSDRQYSPIPARFKAMDTDRTAYFFDRQVFDVDDGNWQTYNYADTCHFKVMDEYASRDTMFLRSDAGIAFQVYSKATWQSLATNDFYQGQRSRYVIEKTGTSEIIGIPVSVYTVTSEWISTGEKEEVERYYVDDGWRCLKKESAYGGKWTESFEAVRFLKAGTFNETFRTIAGAFAEGSVVDIKDMLPQYTRHDNVWISEWYPRALDKIFLKYEGSGTIDEMSVIRIHKYPPYDNVSEISVSLFGVSKKDAEAYLADVKAKTGVNKEMVFDPCYPTCTHELGTTAYGFGYKIYWTTWNGGTLEITFYITHTVHV